MSTPSQHHHFSTKALLRRRNNISSYWLLFTLVLIAATIWNNNVVYGAPAKLDLQPPINEATVVSADDKKALDSYGNPIESLKPIETPDGRKVISAQGLQFEIPNYASGITELKKPFDDLLPPFVDPIAVAVPNDSSESLTTVEGPSAASSSSNTATEVDVENVQLVQIPTESSTNSIKGLPQYIVDLNDPDIGGPVEYMPADDRRLSVIAWDLLPPLDVDPADTNNEANKRKSFVALSASQQHVGSASEHHHFQTSQNAFGHSHHQTESEGSTTPRTTTVKTTTTPRTTTTTTQRTTTTPRTTTTTTQRTTTTPRTTTTRRTTTTTIRTTTTPKPDPSTFFKLEGGDSYTLPSWLADIDDPDLDVAVTYVIPEDINQYNHSIATDILPPLEPYTDLNVLNLTPPTANKPSTTSTTTTTTTTARPTTTTTTTTRRPTTTRYTTARTTTLRPTSQAHWVRARPTTATSTARPISSSFNNQITSSFSSQTFNSPSTSTTYSTTTSPGNYNAQRTRTTPTTPTTSTTTTTTTTTTQKPKTTLNPYNRPSTSSVSNTDKISSEEVTAADIQKSSNPFLGSHNPQPFSKPGTTTRKTTTTTTTTTTTPSPKEVNPFEPTIPPWLAQFDYADVGPGVPFVYNPDEDELPVEDDIQPPSKINGDAADATKTSAATSSSTSNSPSHSQNSDQTSFSNKFSSTATSLTSASSIPSKVTIPLPSIEISQDDNTLTQPQNVFASPPTASAEAIDVSKKTSSTFNAHFPARFEPSSEAVENTNKIPLAADRESFPPFNTATSSSSSSGSNTGSAGSLPTKTTFSKSEDGKVITNNIFLSAGGSTTQSSITKPFGTTSFGNSAAKDGFTGIGSTTTSFTKAGNSFNQFTTSSAASGFVTASTAANSSGTKYTGNFGGPPGVLAPNGVPKPSGFVAASSSTSTKSYNTSPTSRPGSGSTAAFGNTKFTGSFGGPPGVLRPYDNVKTV
ncbi:mucin-2 isoform X2 [Stomoxys calcitrans]|uniref:mucin-2 isoform X2 n=1 Tax=Stomoxys calcitrans TaxID=35570 RepID=UPI0027E3578C|nr:mucin-2 isoform X2 [Stomoxys calcitrans]